MSTLQEWISLSDDVLFGIILDESVTEQQVINSLVILKERYELNDEDLFELISNLEEGKIPLSGIGNVLKTAKGKVGGLGGKLKTGSKITGGLIGAKLLQMGSNALGNIKRVLDPTDPLKKIGTLDDLFAGQHRKEKDKEEPEVEKGGSLKFRPETSPYRTKKEEYFNLLSNDSLLSILENKNESNKNKLIVCSILQSRDIKIDESVLGALGKVGKKLLPGVGTAYSIGSAVQRAKSGDYGGAALDAASAIPGPIGWAATIGGVARDAFKSSGSDSTSKSSSDLKNTQLKTSTPVVKKSMQKPIEPKFKSQMSIPKQIQKKVLPKISRG